MGETNPKLGAAPLSYSGYHRKLDGQPDLFLCQVTRGTPGGEYHRRFWQPVAYLSELGEVPLRVRALGEDLVVFRDLSGRVGCLHLHCSHRNSSLEYGVIEERGLRCCCYHRRLYDVDGTILEMPGEPAAERLMKSTSQGAYPVHVLRRHRLHLHGAADRIPVFPMYDRFTLPGLKIVPGIRFKQDCNWIQIKENPVDAHRSPLKGMLAFVSRKTKSSSPASPRHCEQTFGGSCAERPRLKRDGAINAASRRRFMLHRLCRRLTCRCCAAGDSRAGLRAGKPKSKISRLRRKSRNGFVQSERQAGLGPLGGQHASAVGHSR